MDGQFTFARTSSGPSRQLVARLEYVTVAAAMHVNKWDRSHCMQQGFLNKKWEKCRKETLTDDTCLKSAPCIDVNFSHMEAISAITSRHSPL